MNFADLISYLQASACEKIASDLKNTYNDGSTRLSNALSREDLLSLVTQSIKQLQEYEVALHAIPTLSMNVPVEVKNEPASSAPAVDVVEQATIHPPILEREQRPTSVVPSVSPAKVQPPVSATRSPTAKVTPTPVEPQPEPTKKALTGPQIVQKAFAARFHENPLLAISTLKEFAEKKPRERPNMREFLDVDIPEGKDIKYLATIFGFDSNKATLECITIGYNRLLEYTKSLRERLGGEHPQEFDQDMRCREDYQKEVASLFRTNRKYVYPSELYVAFGLCNPERTAFYEPLVCENPFSDDEE